MPDRDRAAERAITEREIDALYQRPLTEFTTARNELAKALGKAGARDAAARVKALEKPTVTPWAVNQVYWQARSIWDRLMAAGAALRDAQVDALERPGTTVTQIQRARDQMRDAAETHRAALADAVHQAIRASSLAGVNPTSDQLSRMLESISLAASPPTTPGRLTEMIQPAGFEALFGVVPVGALPRPVAGLAGSAAAGARSVTAGPSDTSATGTAGRADGKVTGTRAAKHSDRAARDGQKATANAAEQEAAKEAAKEAARRHAARLQAAGETLAQTRTVEREARTAESLARDRVHDAELTLKQARTALADAESATRKAAEARADAETALGTLRRAQ